VPYLLAAVAVALPIVLIVSSLRGRTRVRCCSVAPEHDRRILDALPD
jgi:hypothetical protein